MVFVLEVAADAATVLARLWTVTVQSIICHDEMQVLLHRVPPSQVPLQNMDDLNRPGFIYRCWAT